MESLFIMQSNYSIISVKSAKNIALFIQLLTILILYSCKKGNDCDVPECNVNLGGSGIVTVTSNVSGGQGTQITPDIIDLSSITQSSAIVKFKVLKIGKCHKVIGYGHTWSSTNGTPTIGTDNFIDYEDNVNFNDEVVTLITNLESNKTYWLRAWIAIEVQNCTQERIVYYNDTVSSFTTK